MDPQLVINGEREELARFQKMAVYEYVTRAEAGQDQIGKKVHVK